MKFFSSDDLFGVLHEKSTDIQNLNCSTIQTIADRNNLKYFPSYDIFDDYKLAVGIQIKTFCHSNKIHIIKLYTGQTIQKIDVNEIRCLKWISKSILAVGKNCNLIELLDLDNNGKCYQVLSGHKSEVTDLCFHKEKNHLISGSKNGEIKIWDLANNECIESQRGFYSNYKIGFRLNSNGYLFSYSRNGKQIKIWNSNQNYKLERVIERDYVILFELTPNGNIVLFTRDRHIEIFDYLTGNCLYHHLNKEINCDFIKFINESCFVFIHFEIIYLYDLNKKDIIEVDSKRLNNVSQLSLLNNGDLVILNSKPDDYHQFQRPNNEMKIKRFQ